MPWLEKGNEEQEKNLLFVHVPRCKLIAAAVVVCAPSVLSRFALLSVTDLTVTRFLCFFVGRRRWGDVVDEGA